MERGFYIILWVLLTSAIMMSDDLDIHANSRIQVKGFLYPTSHPDQMVLTNQPQLRSCCIGSPHLSSQQIIVLGLPPQLPITKVVTLEGTLRVTILKSEEKQGSKKYLLEHSMIVEPEHAFTSFQGFLVFGLALVMMIGAYAIYTRKRRL